MNRVEIKEQAKSMMKGKFWAVFGPIVLTYVILFVFNYSMAFLLDDKSLSYIVIMYVLSFVEVVLSYGITQYMIKFVRGKKPTVNDIFAGKDNFWLVISIALLVSLFTLLWSLLFIIPGIIAVISYSMVYYISIDNKEMKALEVIKESKKMMHGYKLNFFVFSLSFIGWCLLVPVTFGLILIWLIPYTIVATTLYYERLKKAIK